MTPRENDIHKVIEGCRALIATMADPSKQPLEREACYLLAKMLKLQAEGLGLLNQPEVKQALAIYEMRSARPVRRYPDDFVDLFRE